MVHNLPKIVHILQICADLSKKSKFIEEIYLYPSEWSHNTLSENSIFYRDLSNSSQDIVKWNIKKVLTQQNFNKNYKLETLITSKF